LPGELDRDAALDAAEAPVLGSAEMLDGASYALGSEGAAETFALGTLDGGLATSDAELPRSGVFVFALSICRSVAVAGSCFEHAVSSAPIRTTARNRAELPRRMAPMIAREELSAQRELPSRVPTPKNPG
jgi:hypothetical protein